MLKLAAFDADDLAIVSANLQDAIVRASDIVWLAGARRFALSAQRFNWRGAAAGLCERRQTGLHIDHVSAVASTGYEPGRADTLLNLLAIRFEAGDAPSGQVVLTFSGGAAIRLTVECLELGFADLGPRWRAQTQPGHAMEKTD